MTAVIHIAGVQVQVGTHLRQRCSWCGATLCDYELTRIAVYVGEDHDPAQPVPTPGMWETGRLVAVDGNAYYVVEHEDGAELPDGACGKLDPVATA